MSGYVHNILVLWDIENIHPRGYLNAVGEFFICRYGLASAQQAKYRLSYSVGNEAIFKNKYFKRNKHRFIAHLAGKGKDAADRKLIELAAKFEGSVVLLATHDQKLIAEVARVLPRSTTLWNFKRDKDSYLIVHVPTWGKQVEKMNRKEEQWLKSLAGAA